MPTGDQRHCVTRQVGLFNDPDLLLWRPTPSALHRSDHLHALIGSSHTVRHMHHTSISARACQPGGYFTLKNRILLENYFLPGDLEAQIEGFVEHYNH